MHYQSYITDSKRRAAANRELEAIGPPILPSLKKAVDRVTSLSHRAAESLYKASGSQPGPGGDQGPGGATGGEPGKPADDVVDAEYTVKE